jgi:O-antigen ligase
MRLKQQLIRTIVAWGVLVAFMLFFNPAKLPVVVLIAPFVLLFIAIYSTWGMVVLLKRRFYDKNNDPQAPRRRLRLALCLSTVLLIILQSLGQLTLKDVVTLLAIVALGYFFLARNRVGPAK